MKLRRSPRRQVLRWHSTGTAFVERVSEEDSAHRAATAAQIDELRDEIRHLSRQLRGHDAGREHTRHLERESASHDEVRRGAWSRR